MTRRELRRRRRIRGIIRAAIAVPFSIGALVLLVGGAVAIAPLPATALPEASHIYDRNGQLVEQLFVERRTTMDIARMPAHLLSAVVAVEDERFHSHFGVDAVAVARAFVRNLSSGRVVEGGSTITQQLAKNLFLSPERTYGRKLSELGLTLRLEHSLTKDQILEQYLNTIYFGHGSYGVAEAARTYFNRPADTLTLGESALLAGLIKAPERFSPYRDPEAARGRQQLVLSRMVEQDLITADEAEAARREPLEFASSPPRGRQAPHFLQMMIDELASVLPGSETQLHHGGLRIITTLDLDWQLAAEAAMAALPVVGEDVRGVSQPQGALVALDPETGAVRALVGGRSFAESQFNRATQALRQPGSAFKPIVYLAALDQGFLPTARQVCEPVSYPGAEPGQTYTPTDHGPRPYHYRPMGMREALSISDNVVAVRWIKEVGPASVVRYARALGITSPLQPHLALALGTCEVTPLELTAAYAAFANGGFAVDPYTVVEVQDRTGQVLYRQTHRPVQVVRTEVAYLLTDLLTSVMRPGGTGALIGRQFDRPAAAKTGTSENTLDAWFIGYTPDLVAGVYVGYDGPREPLAGTGATVAGPLWLSFMSEALANTSPRRFQPPPRVSVVSVCLHSGLLPNHSCPTSDEVFASPLVPVFSCPIEHDLFEEPPGLGLGDDALDGEDETEPDDPHQGPIREPD